MKLNQVPNFRVEDFQSEQTWIGRLFIQLNPFVQAVNQVLNGNVDFGSNLKSVTRSYDITTFQEFSIQWPYMDNPPVDLRIVKALKGTTQTPTILLVAWEYDLANTLITVNRIVEITDTPAVASLSGRYQFTIRATV